MDWVAKSYFGRAKEEVVIEEVLRVLCFRVAFGWFKGKFCTRCHIWVPNLEKFCERHLLSMDWVAKSNVGRATKEVVIEEFLRVLCFRVAFGRF